MPATDYTATLVRATGQPTTLGAIAWIEEGNALRRGVTAHEVMAALLEARAGGGRADPAIRRMARELATSDLDSGSILLAVAEAPMAARFKRGLNALRVKSPTGSLAGLTAASVRAAQHDEPAVVETLCAIAGLTFKELRARVGSVAPTQPDGDWDARALGRAFAEISRIVEERQRIPVSGPMPARPYELISELSGLSDHGWDAVDRLDQQGVPFAVFLGQRAVGGSWLHHRARTSGRLNSVVADLVCEGLDSAGINYVRSSSIGGDTAPAHVAHVAGDVREAGLVITDSIGDPLLALVFNTANDGGTARRSIDSLVGVARGSVPLAVVLSGTGFARRGREMEELAVSYNGHIYTAETVGALIENVPQLARGTSVT